MEGGIGIGPGILRWRPEDKLQALVSEVEALCVPRRVKYPHYDFTRPEVQGLLTATSDAHSAFGGKESEILPSDVDAPRPFEGTSLLRSVEAAAEMLNVSEHVETLLVRIRTLLTDSRMMPIMEDVDITLDGWLRDYIGTDDQEDGYVSVIDLSLVPTEVVHVVTAVIARMVFEALQRYVKVNGVALPTVLVMEEAHTFIKRYRADIGESGRSDHLLSGFRAHRPGRAEVRTGAGPVLSAAVRAVPTVLSQCNTFLLHRISNDRDQDLVHRFVPDNLRGLLRELPSLPSQSAILLGWASELPILVKMSDLPKAQQPRSDDPEFWGVWVGQDKEGEPISRAVDWEEIAQDWQGRVERGGTSTE